MAKAELAKQIQIKTDNKVGMMAQVASAIAAGSANIETICAYAMDNQAEFYIIVDKHSAAVEALKNKGFEINEKEIVLISAEDKVGELESIAQKIKEAGINIYYIYGTTCGCKDSAARLVISTDQDAEILELINS